MASGSLNVVNIFSLLLLIDCHLHCHNEHCPLFMLFQITNLNSLYQRMLHAKLEWNFKICSWEEDEKYVNCLRQLWQTVVNAHSSLQTKWENNRPL